MLPALKFIRAWNEGSSPAEVAAKFNLTTKAAVMRAGRLRYRGHKLKFYSHSSKPTVCNEMFVTIWNSCTTLDEAAGFLKMCKHSATDRANRLRKRGFVLKKMARGFQLMRREQIAEVTRMGPPLTSERAKQMRAKVKNCYRPTNEQMRQMRMSQLECAGVLRAIGRA